MNQAVAVASGGPTAVRLPAVAGSFYPRDPDTLRRALAACFEAPRGPGRLPTGQADPVAPQSLLAGVVPHAGYLYSGPVAAHFFARLSQGPLPPQVLLLGVDHHGASSHLSVCDADWETPLGRVRTDRGVVSLLTRGLARADMAAHAQEHSLEVELPFLQFVYGKTPLSVVGVQVPFQSFPTLHRWGQGLREALGDRNLLYLASSDLSHYLPRREARRADARALEALVTLSAADLYRRVEEEGISMCGVAPVTVLLSALEGTPAKAEVLSYQDSADAEPMDRVVGYASVAIRRPTPGA